MAALNLRVSAGTIRNLTKPQRFCVQPTETEQKTVPNDIQCRADVNHSSPDWTLDAELQPREELT